MKSIAHIRTDFPDKFGIPRQSGMIEELRGKIIFEPEFRRREALRGLNGFSHIWLLWEFSGMPQYGRPGWEETKGSAYLPRARPSGRILSDFPVCGLSMSGRMGNSARCFLSVERI